MIALALAAVLSLPAGWRDTPIDNPPGSTVEMLRIGSGPASDGFTASINALRRRLANAPPTIEQWAQSSVAFLSSQPDVAVTASHAEKECNGTIDGWRIDSAGTYNGRKLELVQTALLDGGYEYVATYTRAQGTPADDAALKALDTLCPLSHEEGADGYRL